jgi:hypothetical protein
MPLPPKELSGLSQPDAERSAEIYKKIEKYRVGSSTVVIQRAYLGQNGKSVHIHVVCTKPKSSLRIKVLANLAHLDDPKVRSPYKNGIDSNHIYRKILGHLHDKICPEPKTSSNSEYSNWSRLRTIVITALQIDGAEQRAQIHERVFGLCRQLADSGEQHAALKAAKKRSAKTRLVAPLTRAEAAGLDLDDIIDIWNNAIVRRIMKE